MVLIRTPPIYILQGMEKRLKEIKDWNIDGFIEEKYDIKLLKKKIDYFIVAVKIGRKKLTLN